jgi:predicted chitinase
MRPFHSPLVDAVHAPPDGLTTLAPAVTMEPVTTSATEIPWLAQAICAAAPQADTEIWTAVLGPHLIASDIATPRRVAAFLGQAAAEAGPGLAELAEDTLYRHPERLCAIFPSRFPSMAVAQQYVGDATRIACRAYAGKLGNGDEASGDGWHFRGSGLFQITGRSTYEAFARALNAPVEQVAEWTRTPPGAAASACWYWRKHALNIPADAWNLAAVTVGVNGAAMLAHAQRVAAAEAALRAAGGQ